MTEVAHEIAEEAAAEGAAPLPYGNLLERAETIRELILDGSLDPLDGLVLVVCPPPEVLAAEREANARRIRKRYSAEAKAMALALVAGGASCRLAAASVLGDERLRITVWRWARKEGVL